MRHSVPIRRLAIGMAMAVLVVNPTSARGDATPAVTVEEDATTYTLANASVTARVSKRSGDLTSLRYKGLELLTDKSGHAGGYWSHDTTGGARTVTRVTIDPRTNGGLRGEVSVQG